MRHIIVVNDIATNSRTMVSMVGLLKDHKKVFLGLRWTCRCARFKNKKLESEVYDVSWTSQVDYRSGDCSGLSLGQHRVDHELAD
jgi:hypothetical protein